MFKIQNSKINLQTTQSRCICPKTTLTEFEPETNNYSAHFSSN